MITPHDTGRQHDPAALVDALRDWMHDLDLGLTPDEIDELPGGRVLRYVARHRDGGLDGAACELHQQPPAYVGVRHHDACLCGCHRVVGLTGRPAAGYADYARVGLVAVAFRVPSPAGGAASTEIVAYESAVIA